MKSRRFGGRGRQQAADTNTNAIIARIAVADTQCVIKVQAQKNNGEQVKAFISGSQYVYKSVV